LNTGDALEGFVRIYEDGDAPGCAAYLLEQLEQFRHEFRDRIG